MLDGVDNDVTIYLTLQDGDGDVGTPEGDSPSCRADGNFCDYTTDSACINDPFYDVVLIDKRDSCYVLLNLPNLTPSGDIKAISGEVDLFVNGLTCKPLLVKLRIRLFLMYISRIARETYPML